MTTLLELLQNGAIECLRSIVEDNTGIEQKTLYTCSICHTKAQLGFYQAQRLGWYWERRVGIWYDYYCPECDRQRRAKHV